MYSTTCYVWYISDSVSISGIVWIGLVEFNNLVSVLTLKANKDLRQVRLL